LDGEVIIRIDPLIGHQSIMIVNSYHGIEQCELGDENALEKFLRGLAEVAAAIFCEKVSQFGKVVVEDALMLDEEMAVGETEEAAQE
jgi:hypothetical protein